MRITSKTLAECGDLAHGYFTREGGVSEGIFASLNCGPGSGDAPENVRENRRRVMEALEADGASLCTLHQIHSNKVVAVRAPWSDDTRPQADAMVSKTPGMLIGILTADCGPVLFADPKARVIGAAHAGWKGALEGIIEQTVSAMETMGATRGNIRACLGPCIGQDSYEVGAEFYERFMERDGSLHAHFRASDTPGHYRFDLQGFVMGCLTQSGLQHTESLAMDTYTDETRFFSYRRTTHRKEADYGRQISVIMLQDA